MPFVSTPDSRCERPRLAQRQVSTSNIEGPQSVTAARRRAASPSAAVTSGTGAHEHDLELVVGLDAAAGAEHHALERGVDQRDRDLGLLGEAVGQARSASRRRRPGTCRAG